MWPIRDDVSRVLRQLVLIACGGRLRYRAVVGLGEIRCRCCGTALHFCS